MRVDNRRMEQRPNSVSHLVVRIQNVYLRITVDYGDRITGLRGITRITVTVHLINPTGIIKCTVTVIP